MKFDKDQKKDILDMYSKGESMIVIADKYGTYTNKIRRLLIKEGAEIRDKSEAQKLALKSGRHKHPTEGTVRPEEFRIAISEKLKDHWGSLDDTERKRRSDLAKEQWENMEDSQKEKMRENSTKAIRVASKEGSKLEKHIFQELVNNGVAVMQHKTNLIANNKLEVDMYLPLLKTVIEIDGPAHFFPIWGQKSLDRHIRSDAEKVGLLTQQGYYLIRIKNLVKTLSEHHKRNIVIDLLKTLQQIENKQLTNKLIELEVK
jgi:very-short-patch-repair endonuclease